MNRAPTLAAILAVTLGGGAASARPQVPPPGMPTPPPGMMEKLRAIEARARAMPDTPGTGAFPAIKQEVASLPDHVVYRPADLARLGGRRLPIVAWGNGGCQSDGAGQRLHLEEVASHGYLVIANGTIQSGPGAPPAPPRPPVKPGELPPPQTSAAQLTQAIDWAIAENARPGSPLFGKIDTHAVAVSGWSCGGVQALTVATSDPRIKAVVIHDSGLFTGRSPMPAMDLPKSSLAKLRAPIIYILGGPSDIAYANGMDDYARIDSVPAAVVNIGDVGHGGTFYDPNGGKAAQIAVAWLDWRLKGSQTAKREFAGTNCGLCHDPQVTFARKRLDR